jgi:hypothetical protein
MAVIAASSAEDKKTSAPLPMNISMNEYVYIPLPMNICMYEYVYMSYEYVYTMAVIAASSAED